MDPIVRLRRRDFDRDWEVSSAGLFFSLHHYNKEVFEENLGNILEEKTFTVNKTPIYLQFYTFSSLNSMFKWKHHRVSNQPLVNECKGEMVE